MDKGKVKDGRLLGIMKLGCAEVGHAGSALYTHFYRKNGAQGASYEAVSAYQRVPYWDMCLCSDM